MENEDAFEIFSENENDASEVEETISIKSHQSTSKVFTLAIKRKPKRYRP